MAGTPSENVGNVHISDGGAAISGAASDVGSFAAELAQIVAV